MNRLGAQALVALHKLTDFYPPDRPETDGNFLLRATQQLLAGWGRAQLDSDSPAWGEALAEQLRWYETPLPPRQASFKDRLTYRPDAIQGGILTNYGDDANPVRHGALLLMRITDPAKARRFLGALEVQPDGVTAPLKGKAFVNLARHPARARQSRRAARGTAQVPAGIPRGNGGARRAARRSRRQPSA